MVSFVMKLFHYSENQYGYGFNRTNEGGGSGLLPRAGNKRIRNNNQSVFGNG
jgi:hypothetical protein